MIDILFHNGKLKFDAGVLPRSGTIPEEQHVLDPETFFSNEFFHIKSC
jgi:hypothetical protein